MERSKQFTIAAGVCAVLLCICSPSFGKIIYVDDDAPTPGDGSSWRTAYKYLQDALTDAKRVSEPVEVRVAQGVYRPNQDARHAEGNGLRSPFVLFGSIALRGGYAGSAGRDPNARDVAAYASVLSGDLADNDSVAGDFFDPRTQPALSDNSERVVRIQGADPVLLEGFVITGGYGTFGKRIIERGWPFAGGGVSVSSGADATIEDCTFRRNYTDWDGGGLTVHGGAHAHVVGCTFVSNVAMEGGGVSAGGGVELTQCRFNNNRAWRAGGLALYGSAALTGCIISGNTAQEDAGAIWVSGGQVRLSNCVVVANLASPAGTSALHARFEAAAVVTNSIFGQNVSLPLRTPSLALLADDGATIALTYCDISGGWPGTGNMDADPLFADPGRWDPNGTPEDPNDDFFVEGDYHLRSQAGRWDPVTETWVKDDVTSSCVDAGDPNSPIGQEPFPNGGRVNMGAYGGTAEASMSYLAEAKVIYVDDDAPAPGDGSSWQTAYKYLQDALADAQTADKPVEIRVAQGIYKPDRSAAHPQGTGEQSKEWYFRVTDDMSLIGGYAGLSGLDPNARDIKVYDTVLSGDLLGNDAPATDPATLMKDPTRSDNMRVMWVSTNGGHVWLDGCTITGGSGGALVAAGPVGYTDRDVNVTVSNCTFRGNRGLWTDTPVAGAVHTIWRGLRLVRCVFEGNAGPMGGAVLASHAILDSCQFIGNYASDGGAAYLEHGALTNCEFIENRAVNGGAVYLDASSSDTATMVGCIFRGNLALGGSGGAIVCYADLDLVDCLFTANEAFDSGGACFQADSTVILANCVLVGNRAGQDGGAWEAGWQAHLKAVNCTLPDNRSPAGSFLMVRHYEQASSTSIIIWNCILPEGSDSIRSTDVPVRLAYTCVGRGGRSLDATDNCLIWGPGNIEADPCFADPGYWDPNGTPEDPNDDFFVEGDYHLKSQAGRWDPAAGSWVVDDVTSPCIDAGDPNSPIGDEPFPNGGRVNMGAYGGTAEASMSYFDGPVCTTIIAGDINGDGRVDAKDLAILARHRLQAQGQ
jgi:hypothetical protein